MEKDSNQNPHHENEEQKDVQEEPTAQEETVNEHASTYQPEVSQQADQQTVSQGQGEQMGEKDKKINFDFEKSLNETKGILKDAILKPHALISSNRSISMETSAIILVLLSIIIGVIGYFSMQNMLNNIYGGLGSLFGSSDIGISFMFQTMLGWIITFGVGYFSIYLMLRYFGDRNMEHKELLTKYVTVSIPYVAVFCVVLILFGFLMIDYFFVMYSFSLLLFGMIHVYLFFVNVKKPKFDLFWLSVVYLFVLTVLTSLVSGMDMPGL